MGFANDTTPLRVRNTIAYHSVDDCQTSTGPREAARGFDEEQLHLLRDLEGRASLVPGPHVLRKSGRKRMRSRGEGDDTVQADEEDAGEDGDAGCVSMKDETGTDGSRPEHPETEEDVSTFVALPETDAVWFHEGYSTRPIVGDDVMRLPPHAPFIMRRPFQEYFNVAYNTCDATASGLPHLEDALPTRRIGSITDIWQHALDLLFETRMDDSARAVPQQHVDERQSGPDARIRKEHPAEKGTGEEQGDDSRGGTPVKNPHPERGHAAAESEKLEGDMDIDEENKAANNAGMDVTADNVDAANGNAMNYGHAEVYDALPPRRIDDEYDVLLVVPDMMEPRHIVALVDIALTKLRIRRTKASHDEIEGGADGDRPADMSVEDCVADMKRGSTKRFFRSATVNYSSVAASFAEGIPSCLVVDAGASTTSITAVDEGSIVASNRSASRSALTFGINHMQRVLERMLQRDGGLSPEIWPRQASIAKNDFCAEYQRESVMRHLLRKACSITGRGAQGKLVEFTLKQYQESNKSVLVDLSTARRVAPMSVFYPLLLVNMPGANSGKFLNEHPFTKWKLQGATVTATVFNTSKAPKAPEAPKARGSSRRSRKSAPAVDPDAPDQAAANDAGVPHQPRVTFGGRAGKGNIPSGAAGDAVLVSLARVTELMDGCNADEASDEIIDPLTIEDHNKNGILGLEKAILQVLLECENADMRRTLLQNIVVVGEMASWHGFEKLLQYRMESAMPFLTDDAGSSPGSVKHKIRVLRGCKGRSNPRDLQWVGGSYISVFDTLKDGWVKRDQWMLEFPDERAKYSTVPPTFAHVFNYIGI